MLYEVITFHFDKTIFKERKPTEHFVLTVFFNRIFKRLSNELFRKSYGVKKSVFTLTVIPFEVDELLGILFNSLSAASDDCAGNFRTTRNRITSYNVCYTKLLRLKKPE